MTTPLLLLSLALTPQQSPATGVPWTAQTARADVDGDGLVDVLLPHPSGARLLLGRPGGGFEFADLPEVDRVRGVAAAWRDLDEDGDPDALLWGTDAVHVLRNDAGVLRDVTAEAGLESAQGVVRDLQWLDLDGDGVEDLLLLTDAGVVTRRNLGQCAFEPWEAAGIPTPGAPRAGGAAGLAAPANGVDVPQPPPTPGGATGDGSSRRAVRPAGPHAPTAASAGTAGVQSGPVCAASIADALNGGCIEASTTPTLGMLMPLSSDLNVDASGNVGVGTTSPGAKLDVAGDVRASGTLRSEVVGAAPLAVQSSTLVPNLNADLLDGKHASAFTQLGSTIEGSEITDGTLTNADLSASAAISGSKVVPNFGSQTVSTQGLLGVGTKAPLVRAHVRDGSLGLGAAHLSGETLAVEADDAFLGLVANGTGKYGSGLTMREVTSGALADVWAMLRETSGSGSRLTFTHGANASPWLNQTVLALDPSGAVGIGTNFPQLPLEVGGGTDASPTGGGYALLGSDTGRNIVLDDNEIMARNNGAASTLYLNNEGGNVSILGNGTGNVGIGVFSPTARLQVAGPSGDGTVVLPTGSIGPDEMACEPGVASMSQATKVFFDASDWTTIASQSITTPCDGYILVLATVQLVGTTSASSNYQAYLAIRAGTANLFSQAVQVLPGAGDTFTISKLLQRSKGTLALSFDCRVAAAGITGLSAAQGGELTLLFFPTAYGPVQ